MRILHIDKFFGDSELPLGGVGNNVMLLAGHQRQAGHEVAFFGASAKDDAAQRGMPVFHDFTASRNPLLLATMIHNAQAAACLDKLLRCRRFDVAHLHNIYHHLTPSILPVLAAHRVGVVLTARDYRMACPSKHFWRPRCPDDGPCTRCQPNRFYHAMSPRCLGLGGLGVAIESIVQRFFRRYFRWVDYFICPTDYMRSVLLATGLPRSKAVVIRNLIKPMAVPQGRGPRPRRLLYAGRLSWEKGPQRMLDLAERMRDVEIMLAGDGPMLAQLQAQAAAKGLSNVRFALRVPHEQVGELMAESAAMVVPSLCPDNSPGAMLEAMRSLCCVIVPDHPSLREWVQDGRTGRLFRGSPASGGDGQAAGGASSGHVATDLETAARQVLDDPSGREAMANAARELVIARHEPTAILRAIDELYEEAIRRCELRW